MFPWNKRPDPLKTFNKHPYTDAGVNFRIERRRIQSTQRRDIKNYVHASNMANVCDESNRRVTGGRARNEALRRAGEQSLERIFQQREDAKRLVEKRQKDNKLATAMADMDRQTSKEEREVARICENDPSLRALKSKIQAAYMNKERVEQAAQKRERELVRKKEDAEFYKAAEENLEGLLAKEKQKEEAKREQRERQRIQIQAQLKHNENTARLRKIQEFQVERDQVHKIIIDIQNQVDAENRAAVEKKDNLNRMRIEGLRLRAEEQARVNRENEELRKRIASHKEKVAHRNDSLIARKQAEARVKEEIRLQIEQEALERKQRAEEMRAALDTLRKEGKEKEEERKEKEKARRKHENKMIMMRANEQQKMENKRKMEEIKRDEAVMVARMKEKFRQDNRKAQEKERKHNLLEENYKKEIHQQMATRSEFFASAKRVDHEAHVANKEQEKFRERVVEEARKAILREHAAKLKDYLPKGVFSKESDLEMISVFDTDGDDVLSAAEVSAAKKRLLAYGDADGDGRLDESERDRAFLRLRSAVDTDGDGQLSAGERAAARQLNTR